MFMADNSNLCCSLHERPSTCGTPKDERRESGREECSEVMFFLWPSVNRLTDVKEILSLLPSSPDVS